MTRSEPLSWQWPENMFYAKRVIPLDVGHIFRYYSTGQLNIVAKCNNTDKETKMPDILHELTIAAAPDAVFKAITEQPEMASWWTTHIDAEPKVGSMVEARFFDGNSVHKLEVVSLEPARRV